jgi:hypothetical protein
VLQARSHRNQTIHTSVDATGLAHLQALAHRSPRDFGHPTSVWTLDLLAEEAFGGGLTGRRVSDETIRQAIMRLGTSWKRASAGSPVPIWSTSEKRRRDWLIRLAARHPDWALGFGDETWWTRVKQPSLQTWTDEPVRLVEQSVATHDPDPGLGRLRPAPAIHRRTLAAVCRWTSRERDHHPVPGRLLPTACSPGHDGAAAGLGQQSMASFRCPHVPAWESN